MKHCKKIAALLLAIALLACCVLPALAVEERPNTPPTDGVAMATPNLLSWQPITGANVINITNVTGIHTYQAYQIFKGDLDRRIQLYRPTGLDFGANAENKGFPVFSGILEVTETDYKTDGGTPVGDPRVSETVVQFYTRNMIKGVQYFVDSASTDSNGTKTTINKSDLANQMENTAAPYFICLLSKPEVGIDLSSTTNADSDTGLTTVTTKKIKNLAGVYEQALTGLQWGNGITDEGVLALYNTYVAGDTANPKPKLVKEQDGADVIYYLEGDVDKTPVLLDNYCSDVADKLRGLKEEEAADLADLVSKYLTTTCTENISGNGTAQLSVSDPGYYFIKDKDNSTGIDAYTRFMLQVAGNITVQPKASVPTLVKKVYENSPFHGENESGYDVGDAITEGTNVVPFNKALPNTKPGDANLQGNWNDVADYNIGESIPFVLIGTLPTTYNGYKHYSYTVTDTLAPGLSLDIDGTSTGGYAVAGYIMDQAGNILYRLQKDNSSEVGGVHGVTMAVETKADGSTVLTLKIADVKALQWEEGGQTRHVTANDRIVFTYKAKLNKNAVTGSAGNENKVTLTYTNDPNWNGNGEGDEPTATTPEDKTVVYTYQMQLHKIALQDNANLAGAGFSLKRKSDNQYYCVDETTGEISWSANVADAATLTTDGNGLLTFKGLDDGQYVMREVNPPFGYNALNKDIEFSIDANIYNTNKSYESAAAVWTGKNISLSLTGSNNTDMVAKGDASNGDAGSGLVKLTVKNKSGAQLPTTGGIGTTLFYVVGTILAIGAGVVLVAKRRMDAE